MRALSRALPIGSAMAFCALMSSITACTFNSNDAECVFDDDCRGDDLCEGGECIDPDDLDEDSDGNEGEGEGEGAEGEGEGEAGEGEGEGEDLCANQASECAAFQYTSCTCGSADPCNWSDDGVCDATPCGDAFGFAFDDGNDCGEDPPPPPPPPADADSDGVEDAFDNCPNVANFFQENRDADTSGDACDSSTYSVFEATILENRDRCDDGGGPPPGASSFDLLCWRILVDGGVVASRLKGFDSGSFTAHDGFQSMAPSSWCGRHEIQVKRDDVTGELFLVGERSFEEAAIGTAFTSTFKNSWFSTSPSGNTLAGELSMECDAGGTCSSLSIHMATSSQSAFTEIDFECNSFGEPIVTGFSPL